MITALKTDFKYKNNGKLNFLDRLKKDEITIDFLKARGVCLKLVTYKSYKKKISLSKLDCATGHHKTRLLCAENLKFPTGSGYKRFYTPYFSARLCTNMALEIAKNCKTPQNLKIGLYDINGDFSDLPFHLLKYVQALVIVTENNRVYEAELDYLMNELGATAIVTEKKSELGNCNFVIAPMPIKESLPVKSDAIVLTNEKPLVQQSGLVYYNYQIKMPNGFAKIKPDNIDEVYFCSALYVLEKQYELGTIVPLSCSNSSSSQTVNSICKYFDRA